ncbi:glycosyltransferase [Virgibacillus sp. MG-45]|uniref:glycosyltransferase n=1 Tax=Virgibacillus sp. MG-45 TaxID=3102791 RepID=UPI002ED9C9E1
MKQNTPIILVNSLNVVRGGLTKAVFTRANTLAEKFDKVYIFTFLYQQNFKQIIDTLYKTGLLNKKVEVLNLFEDFKPRNKMKRKIKHSVSEKGLVHFKDAKPDNPSYRYYKNGLYVKYKRFDKNGNLLFIDHMNESRHRVTREEYDLNGYLYRMRHMDFMLNKSRLDRYFDLKGNCYLTVWINPNNNKESRVVLFENEPKEYASMDALKKVWLERRLNKISNPVVLVDNRPTDKLVQSLGNNVKKVAVIHNNHFKKPFDASAEIRDEYIDLLENQSSFHKIVCLTQEQKEDIEQKYGRNDNIVVIPHPAMQVNQRTIKEIDSSFDPHLAVSLARYVSQKRLDEAIRAFKIVVQSIPKAKFYIYGFGKEKDKLVQIINELELENNVKLKGFTADTTKIYKSAACSVLTSDFEGFGMVLTESLAAGTPVVSYNAKYGPSDIVRDGIDGFLVERGNKEQLADRIIKIMNNRKVREELSENALQVNRRFSVEKYAAQWTSLLKGL